MCDCESALSTDHVLCKAEKMDLWSSWSQGLGWGAGPQAKGRVRGVCDTVHQVSARSGRPGRVPRGSRNESVVAPSSGGLRLLCVTLYHRSL